MLTIIKGEDKTFQVTLRDGNGDPYDLTGATEITFCFPGASATQTVTLGAGEVVVDNAVLGKLSVTVDDTKTDALLVGEEQTFEAMIDVGADRKKVQFLEQLTVVESIC